MKLYYATCPAGLEEVAGRIAVKNIPGAGLKEALSGAVIYTAKSDASHPVFQNTYLLITRYDWTAPLEDAAGRIAADHRRMKELNAAIAARGYGKVRIMFSDANRLASVSQKARLNFEKRIDTADIDRVKPDAEVLILQRQEGKTYLLLRLTRGAADKKAKKGELQPAVALCMAHLAKPTPDGVFLDPFAGSGALIKARRQTGACRALYASDIDAEKVKSLKAALKGATVEKIDARSLPEWLDRASITELVTDPPWGLFAPLPEEPKAFYAHLLDSFAHVLAPGGRLVLLSADKDQVKAALSRHQAFEIGASYPVLINGKKATIYSALRAE